ncbi:MAG: hypothetical protein H8E87_00010 [FCB group bacterium]|nr:hypothetical protein [FCB group bacterium]
MTIISYLGCINPFAPESGDISGSMVPDASTVGGMLELFEYSYNTKDSLYYSQLLDSSFVFQYYDAANSRYDQWYRYTDLKATGGLFRNFEVIDLSWYLPDSAVLAFDYTDSLVQVIVNFNLTLDNTVIYGFARFDCYKRSGGKFKITAWKDDF